MKNLIVNLFVLAGLFLATTSCNNKNEPQIPDICDAVQARDFQKVAEATNKFLATVNNSLSDEAKFEKLRNWLLAQDCVENIDVWCHFCVRGLPPQSALDITFDIGGAEVAKTMLVTHSKPSWTVGISDINPPSPLINKTWTLIAISGEGKPNIVDNYTIIFNEDGTIEFPLFCNFLSGSYVVDSVSFIVGYGSISFSNFCYLIPGRNCGELSALENFVIDHLSKAVMYSVQDNNLTIECEDGVYLFFEAM